MKKIILTILSIVLINAQAYASLEYISISTSPQTIEFHLENSAGSISGYTPSGIMAQIPNITAYEKTSEITSGDDVLGEYEKSNSLKPKILPANIAIGKYKIVIYGNTLPTNTRILIDMDWSDNIQWDMKYIGFKMIYPNAIWIYEFDVPATPINNGQIILTKVSTPIDLIKDLTTAGQLSYIGNKQFASEIIKKTEAIGLSKSDQKKGYTELLTEITEKYNKPEGDEFVRQEAYTVLKEDLEYIIGHIQ